MGIVQICELMHWTFEEYEAQPQWFIDTLSIKMEEDTKYQQSQNKPGK